MIRPVESPVQQIAGAQQVVSQGLQIQQEQQQLKDQHALTEAMKSWDGKDANQLPMLVLRAGGSGQAAMAIGQKTLAIKAQTSEIAKNDSITAQNQADTAIKFHDEVRGRILNIVGMKDPASKNSAWDSEVTKEEQAGRIQPGQISHQYPGDDQATSFANSFALGSKLQQEANERQRLALEAWKPSGGQLVNAITGEKIGGLPSVDPLNAGFKARYAVLHPGEQIPDHFQLKTGASPTDFDRVDKLLEATERATATKTQQETLNAIRAQTFEMQRDKSDMKAVMGTDPKTGNAVMLPKGQADQMQIQNPMEAPADTVNKALAARHWLNLANTQVDSKAAPEDMGIMQLVDKLDKEGKLGAVASRWNEFMAGKVGAGDPEVSALRAKMGLSTTLLMQAHVGNRGSSQMLEHFEDLANQKKLDGPTLKAALGAEIDYVKDRAMDPNPPNWMKQAPAKTTPTKSFAAPAGAPPAPKEDGHTLKMNGKDIAVSKDGKWVAP